MSASNTISFNSFFSPASVPGCSLWLDAADSSTLTLSGSNVTGIQDKSPLRLNVSVSTTKPTLNTNYTNNLPGFSFTGSQWFRGTFPSLYTGTSLGVYIVASMANTTALYGRLVSLSSTNNLDYDSSLRTSPIQRQTTSQGISAYRNPLTASIGISAYDTPILMETEYTGANLNMYTNGNLGTSPASSGSFGINNFGIAYLADYGGSTDAAYWTGGVGEVIIILGPVTTAQRQNIEGYLAWKWGLVSGLPVSHPYKTTPINSINILPNSVQTIGNVPLAPSRSPFAFFRPTNITGCQLWLDAADAASVTVAGGVVTNVNDKSGCNVNLSNATGFAYQNNNFNVIYPSFYNGTQYASATLGENAAFTISQPYTTFFVGRKIPSLNFYDGYIFDGTVSRMGIYGSTYTMFATGSLSTSDLGSTNVIQCGIFNTSNSSNFANGTLASSGNLGSGTLTGIIVGNRYTKDNCWMGNFCEFLMYTGALSTTQRQQVEGYLAWKWGLSGNLPSTHPFKNVPPGLPIPSIPPRLTMNNRLFSPLSITGTALWLDAADSTTLSLTGTTLTQWNDKSGNGRNASGGVSPTFSNNGVVFNGSSTYLTTTYSANPSAESIFSVFTFSGSTDNTNYFIIGSTTANNRNYGVSRSSGVNSIVWDKLAVAAYAATSGVTSNVRLLTSGIFNGTSGTTGLNGSNQSVSANFNFSGVGNTSVGAYIYLGTPGGYFNGTINEIVIYNLAISVSQRQLVEGYLAWKWGLQGSLPANHPWKKWPPPPS